MAAVEKEVARAGHEASELAARLREVSAALLDANQALAQIPLLKQRLEEVWEGREWLASQNAELRAENERLAAELQALSR